MRPFMFSSAAEDQPRDTWQKMQLFASAPTVRCRWRNILATMYGLCRLLRDASCMNKRCEIVLEGGTKDRNSLAMLQLGRVPEQEAYDRSDQRNRVHVSPRR